MKENERNQIQGVRLPPVWCGSICRNVMNEICVESCAIKRDCSGFDPKPDLTLANMPRFPNTKSMSREERFASVTIYLAKVVDHLKGIENEHETFVIRRPQHLHFQELSPVVKVGEVAQALANELAPAMELELHSESTTKDDE